MSATTVASRLPGRLRLRHPGLRRPQGCAQALFDTWEGVAAAEGAPATGGMLLRYDPTRLSTRDMEARASAALDDLFGTTAANAASAPSSPISSNQISPRPGPVTRPAAKRLINIGMLASMTATLGALAYGKKLHAVMGAGHLLFLAFHLAANRKKLSRDLSLS